MTAKIPKKAFSSLPVPVARILKIAGAVVTLITLFDILISPLPYQFGDRQWQIEVVTSVVERGIRLLVGIALFLTGCGVSGSGSGRSNWWQDLRFWALALASLLGLIYLLAFPLHLYNVQAANQEAAEKISEINQKGDAASKQISAKVAEAVAAQRQIISQLLTANEEQIGELVKTEQIPPQMADTLKQLKAKPDLVEPFLKQQETELRNQGKQLETELEANRQSLIKVESRKTDDLKGLRTGVGSLLLAVGFTIVGWMGLRDLRQS